MYLLVFFIGCQNFRPPSHDFSNFYGTTAEEIVKAIENNNLEVIREEAKKNKEILNFKDPKYNISLLSIAILNNKKKAFEELLKLGADPNIMDGSCGNPLDSAIMYSPPNCDLFFINKLIEYGANVRLRFDDKKAISCNSILNNEAIVDVIIYKNDDMDCGIEMLKALTSHLRTIDLSINNNSKDYRHNIVYSCLSTSKNLKALKFFIIDLKCKVPDKIFIDGTVIEGFGKGYLSLNKILANTSFPDKNQANNEEIRQELLKYLERND